MFVFSVTIVIDLNRRAQQTLERNSHPMALAPSLGIHFALLRMQFLLIMCKNFYDYVQVKILMWLQKTSPGRDERLIIKLMWPNETNFMAAEKELRKLTNELVKDSKFISTMASKKIKWTINPSYVPHFGGVFEVMITAAKKAIVAILGNSDATDEELMTAFTGAEALINSRPLTYQSANPQDDISLTPNYFLHGQLGGMFAPETLIN